jgi:hypothetical protein
MVSNRAESCQICCCCCFTCLITASIADVRPTLPPVQQGISGRSDKQARAKIRGA